METAADLVRVCRKLMSRQMVVFPWEHSFMGRYKVRGTLATNCFS